MAPTVAPSDPDKGPENRPYERVLSEIAKKLTNQPFLFVIAIAILFVGLEMATMTHGTSNLRFVVLVIAFLALAVIIVYFIIEVRGKVVAQGEQLENQRELLYQLVKNSLLSADVFRHLAGVTILTEYFYWENDEVNWNREFYDLKHRSFIEGKLGKICEFYKELNGTNITEIVKPTRMGLLYVKLRKEDIPKEWLNRNNPKLNKDVVKELGLEIAGDGTISAS
jgi:hypothetical protein